MNETLENIKTRRSVRKFRPAPVPETALRQIVEAGTFAASGHDRQPWLIIAVTNAEVRAKLSQWNAMFLEGRPKDPFYGAPAVIIVLASKRKTPNYLYDGTLSMGNMMLAAHALGLASCWINRARQEFETGEWKEWLRSLGYDADEYEGIGHLSIGYADGPLPEARPRKEGRVVWVE